MKKFLLMITGAVVFAIVLSQTIPNKQEKIIVLKVPESKIPVILKGVAKLPLEESADIYMSIVAQTNQQLDTVKNKK